MRLITSNSAISGGTISNDGGAAISARGVVWSTSQNPTISLSTKTSDGIGIGSFESLITSLSPSTTYYVRAFASSSLGTAYGNQLVLNTDSAMTFNAVTSTSGKVWMDRNLGASRVAISSTDKLSYGGLFQWGRGADGHQKRDAQMTSTLSGNDYPGHNKFITVNSGNYDWRTSQNNNLWQGVNGINNPCPIGFRVPTIAELTAERSSWSKSNSEGAFNSPLKLPLSGYRNYGDGTINTAGSFGYYWSSSVFGVLAQSLSFYSTSTSTLDSFRVYGFSVRCIKD